MNHTCRAANMKYLMRNPEVRYAAEEMIDAYNEVHTEDRRGTRIREAFTEQTISKKKETDVVLGNEQFRLLCQLLDETPRSISPGISSRTATIMPRLSIEGVSYRAAKDSQKDSNLLFRLTGSSNERAGRIEVIFRHTRLVEFEKLTEAFLIVKPYEELRSADIQYDPYRKYKWAGGQLYHNKLMSTSHIVRPAQVVSHFAKTEMDMPRIGYPCIHVLPLNRVCIHVSPKNPTSQTHII